MVEFIATNCSSKGEQYCIQPNEIHAAIRCLNVLQHGAKENIVMSKFMQRIENNNNVLVTRRVHVSVRRIFSERVPRRDVNLRDEL